ncbi:MAG: YihY/virulence factor BrkB family protein [Rickettsiales bacterium]|jgi:membrane protein|nr:YihY/virulence factor BrkB family protein [Rickettsiales bacterium]
MTSFKTKFNIYFHCLRRAAMDTIRHDGVEHAGYLSFLAILSLFPFLVFLFSFAAWLGEIYLGEELAKIIISHLPDAHGATLAIRIKEITSGPPQNLLNIAILGAIWTASSSVEGLKTILNRAYRVHTPPSYLFRRLMSIAQFLLMVSIIIITMTFMLILPFLIDWLENLLNINDLLGGANRYVIVRYGVSMTIWFSIISLIYYFIPNLKQSWRNIMPGAFLVVILWSIISTLFSIYLSNFNQVNLIYGSLAGFIVALLFFYLLSMVLIFGAEFNYAVEKATGFKFKEKVKKIQESKK